MGDNSSQAIRVNETQLKVSTLGFLEKEGDVFLFLLNNFEKDDAILSPTSMLRTLLKNGSKEKAIAYDREAI